jgi:hypothetical protein
MMGGRTMKVLCKKDIIEPSGRKAFIKGKIYESVEVRKSLLFPNCFELVVKDEFMKHGIAHDENEIWTNDKWFKQYFKVIES